MQFGRLGSQLVEGDVVAEDFAIGGFHGIDCAVWTGFDRDNSVPLFDVADDREIGDGVGCGGVGRRFRGRGRSGRSRTRRFFLREKRAGPRSQRGAGK